MLESRKPVYLSPEYDSLKQDLLSQFWHEVPKSDTYLFHKLIGAYPSHAQAACFELHPLATLAQVLVNQQPSKNTEFEYLATKAIRYTFLTIPAAHRRDVQGVNLSFHFMAGGRDYLNGANQPDQYYFLPSMTPVRTDFFKNTGEGKNPNEPLLGFLRMDDVKNHSQWPLKFSDLSDIRNEKMNVICEIRGP